MSQRISLAYGAIVTSSTTVHIFNFTSALNGSLSPGLSIVIELSNPVKSFFWNESTENQLVIIEGGREMVLATWRARDGWMVEGVGVPASEFSFLALFIPSEW
jgi:hypothetical protein